MLRVSDETRERVQRLGREKFGGASADETVRRLLDQHWEAAAVAAVDESRKDDPEGWAEYLTSADRLSQGDAPVSDGWSER